jgi:hypothetical protein
MLTLQRFRALAAAYGADLNRWPQKERDEARILLQTSAQARMQLQEALMLDEVIATGTANEKKTRNIKEQEIALSRLRIAVAERISRPVRPKTLSGRHFVPALFKTMCWTNVVRVGDVRVAAAACLTISVGLLIGWTCAARPISGDLISVLEAAPMRILTNEHEYHDR